MWTRSITRAARPSMPQSQATATLPRKPSARGTSFQPVPLHRVQFSIAMNSSCSAHGPLPPDQKVRRPLLSPAHSIRGSMAARQGNFSGKLWRIWCVRKYTAPLTSSLANRHAPHARWHPDDRVPLRLLLHSRRDPRQLLLHDLGEFAHLPFHLNHLFAHVQNDFDAGEVHAHVARQRENYVEAFQIAVGIKPRVALRPRRLQQPNPFI